MIEAVLFDIDGTLLDHDAAAAASLRRSVGRELGREISDADFEAISLEWRRLEHLHYDSYLRREIDLEEQRRRRVAGLLEFVGLPRRRAPDLDDWFAGFLIGYRESWALFDDVPPVLDEVDARGLVPGVITNADGTFQRAKLEGVGIRDRFPHFVASSEAGFAKPEAGIFEAAAELVGLEPSRIAYVGDRLDTDARGARDAGMTGVWLNRIEPDADVSDVPMIRTLADLSSILDRIGVDGSR